MTSYDEIYENFVGKNKVQPLYISEGADGVFTLFYKEGKRNDQITCENRDILDRILIEFGGKNPETCKTEERFLKFDGTWCSDDLNDLGHVVTKICISGVRTTRNKKITLYPPDGCGEQGTLESVKKGKDIIFLHMQDMEKAEFTRSFNDRDDFDNLIKWVFSEQSLMSLKWTVKKLCTRSKEVEKHCVWKRTLAGDGTKRMVLELTELDGIKYQDCIRQDLFDAAGDMFDAPCKVVNVKPKNEPTKKLCWENVLDKKIDLMSFEAAN